MYPARVPRFAPRRAFPLFLALALAWPALAVFSTEAQARSGSGGHGSGGHGSSSGRGRHRGGATASAAAASAAATRPLYGTRAATPSSMNHGSGSRHCERRDERGNCVAPAARGAPPAWESGGASGP